MRQMYRIGMAMHRRWPKNWSAAGQGFRWGRFLGGESLAKLCQRLLSGIFHSIRICAFAFSRALLCATLTAGVFAAEWPVPEAPGCTGMCAALGSRLSRGSKATCEVAFLNSLFFQFPGLTVSPAQIGRAHV